MKTASENEERSVVESAGGLGEAEYARATKQARFESHHPAAVRQGDDGPLALLSLPDLVLARLLSEWLGWNGALALRAVSRDACAMVASHQRVLRWLLADVLPLVMACSIDRVPFPADSPRAALSLLSAPCGYLFARPDLETVASQWFAGQEVKERSQSDSEMKRESDGENESENEDEEGRRKEKEAAMKLLDGVLAHIEAVRHQRRIEQVSFWESVDTRIDSGPRRQERSMTAQEIADFIKQNVRVRSYVRVWKSWIRLVECELEVTATDEHGKPEKHVLRIVEYNSAQYHEESEELLWNHYSGIFHTSPAELNQQIYFHERAPGQMDEEWGLSAALRALANRLPRSCTAQELLAVLLLSARCELPGEDIEANPNPQQIEALLGERWHDQLMKPRRGGEEVAASRGDEAVRVISRASELQLAQLSGLVERWKYRVGQSQVYLAAGMFGMNGVLQLVPHIGPGRASAALLQAPEGDVLSNCDAVMKLTVPNTGGEFLEVHCNIDTTAREADYARVVLKIRASSPVMADRFGVSDEQPFFVFWSNPQLEEGERDDGELPPNLCRTHSLLELARTFGISPPSNRPDGDHDHDNQDDHNGEEEEEEGEAGLAQEMAALLLVCACAPAAPILFVSKPSVLVHPVVMAVAKVFEDEQDDEPEEEEEDDDEVEE